MDFNFPLPQTENSVNPKIEPLPAEKTIKRRRRKSWKPKGLLSLYLRSFELEAKRASAKKIFDLNLPPSEDVMDSSAAKRIKRQKKTKGKDLLKFGLSDEDKFEDPGQEAESSLSSSSKFQQIKENKIPKKKMHGAADQQSKVDI